jgi:hypothetical protein
MPRNYYRLPWSMTDNAISWLEVTTSCNLACKGCYRPHVEGHKSLEEVASDLAVFKRERKSDCMSIAGGDPLVHPKIVEIVAMIKEGGWKPILNTNGLALTPKKLKKLKQAGAFGVTFHIDTSQDRRDSPYTREVDHNLLRERLADMLAAEGGLTCAFNATVNSDTIEQIPDIVRWALKHPAKVHSVVFILYREPRFFGDYDFFAKGKKIQFEDSYEKTDPDRWGGGRDLKAHEVVAKIREVLPGFDLAAYLNGTEDPTSIKWGIGARIGNAEKTFGFATPKFMEAVQQVHRLLKGKWLAYSAPWMLRAGRSAMAASGIIDSGMRSVAGNYMRYVAKNPLRLGKTAYIQTFTIIQPADILPDGRMDMCDSCPDMTVYEGKMYWSCRLEEVKTYGCFVSAVPKAGETGSPSKGDRSSISDWSLGTP